MSERTKYPSVYCSNGTVDAWELGRACRAAGARSPEDSSPYKHRGIILDKAKHQSFVQGWTDEDMSIISQEKDD